ncbi:MAG: DUF2817 domain-containing protein [Woeseiaceae bacterium]|jgi:succinylglutamate desuccinylase
MTFADYFSKSYEELRDKFLAVAAGASAGVEHFRCPADGPAGQALYTDVARLGSAAATKLLVLVAGTHGVEGYSGSGCLTAWLDWTARRPLPGDTAVVLINLLNPYGAAWSRRQNEDNVDVNRNFIDHSAPPANPPYDALHHALVPAALDAATLATAQKSIRAYRDEFGDEKYWRAYGGQYSHPDGVFYGGSAPVWSNRLLNEVLTKHCSGADNIAFVDLHSGLGPFGHGTIISADPMDSENFARAKSWYGDSLITLASVDSADDSETGTGQTEGLTMGCVAQLFPDREVTCATLEFGTFDFEDCIPQMQADAWLHAHGDPLSAEGEEIRREWLQVFYPDSDDWLEMIWRRSDQVIRQSIAGLTGLEHEPLPTPVTDRSTVGWRDYFSSSYAEARSKFLEAANRNAVACQTYSNPASGPAAENLMTDVAFAGSANAAKLLVIISGTHGVEFLAGAGCQAGWLDAYDSTTLPENTAALLIHAINPYGAAWCRRFNEDNVDINRNFVDHSKPHFDNPYYARIHDLLVPRELRGPGREEARQRLDEFRETNGEQAYQLGFLGQYSHPDGFYFGGTQPTWSNRTLRQIINEYCRDREHVAVIDLHTGLGAYGYGTVGILAAPGSTDAARAGRWYGNASVLFAEVGQTGGYLDYSQFQEGFVLQAFNQELSNTCLTLGGIEFGTYPIDTITEAEIDELWLYNHPEVEKDTAADIRRQLLHVYYPNSDDWLEMIRWRFDQVVAQSLTGLAHDD